MNRPIETYHIILVKTLFFVLWRFATFISDGHTLKNTLENIAHTIQIPAKTNELSL